MAELLVIEGVSKDYSRGGRWTRVLTDVSCGVSQGEIAAVYGGRLAGKTTLLRIVAGLERSDKGRMSLRGVDLNGLSDHRRSRLLGREVIWLDRKGPGPDFGVSRFVGLSPALHGSGRREADRTARKMLERVGAGRCVGQSWGDLSNWQQMLVGLARGFAGEPALIIFDDLLDALGDDRATEEAFDLLRSLLEEFAPTCGVLMGSSNINTAMFADSIWALSRKGTLTLRSSVPTEGEIVPFPGRQVNGGSQSMGSS